MAQRFSSTVYRYLRMAGWHEGRNVSTRLLLPDGFDFHESSRNILGEFGGLSVGNGMFGTRAPEVVNLVRFNPLLATGEEDRFSHFSKELGLVLNPLGEIDHGEFFLGADEQGKVYLLEQDIFYVAEDINRALETLLTGGPIQWIEVASGDGYRR